MYSETWDPVSIRKVVGKMLLSIKILRVIYGLLSFFVNDISDIIISCSLFFNSIVVSVGPHSMV